MPGIGAIWGTRAGGGAAIVLRRPWGVLVFGEAADPLKPGVLVVGEATCDGGVGLLFGDAVD